jgi:hypothetical protein
LRSEGTVEAWGLDHAGQLSVPAPDPDFVDVLAGNGYGIALRSDGTAVSWGDNFAIPEPDNHDLMTIEAFTPVTVAALRFDGSIVVWSTEPSAAAIPTPNEGFIAVSADASSVAAIRAGTPAAVEPTLPRSRVETLSIAASPNPFNPRVEVTVRSELTADVTLEVLDLRGRRVRVLWRGQLAGSVTQAVSWDGRDGGGREMPSGTYLVHARAGAARTTEKIVLVR